MNRSVLRLAIVGLTCAALACNGDPAANPAAPDTAGLAAQAVGAKKPPPPDPVDLYDYQVDFVSGMSGSAIGITNEDNPENGVWISRDTNPGSWLDFPDLVALIPGGSECFGDNLEHVAANHDGAVARFPDEGDPSTWPYAVAYVFEAKGTDSSTPVTYRLWLDGHPGQLGEGEWLPPEGQSATVEFYSAHIYMYGGTGNLKKVACKGGSDSFWTTVTVTNLGPHQ